MFWLSSGKDKRETKDTRDARVAADCNIQKQIYPVDTDLV